MNEPTPFEWLTAQCRRPQVLLGVVEHADAEQGVFESGPSLVLDVATPQSLLDPFQSFERSQGATFDWGKFHLKTFLVSADWRAVKDQLQTDLAVTPQWFVFELANKGPAGTPVEVYPDLLVPQALLRWLKSIERVPDDVQEVLTAFSMSTGIPDASEDEIRNAIATGREAHRPHVAVYDIGQGNCNAICEDNGTPALYYDFGRPTVFNAASAPTPWPAFCFNSLTPIVLSHWDLDHCNGARMPGAGWHPDAIRQEWIAPRQYMGPSHLALASAIVAIGKLHYWPRSLPSISVRGADIVMCTGGNHLLPRYRNDTGLAMYAWSGPAVNSGDSVLLGNSRAAPKEPASCCL